MSAQRRSERSGTELSSLAELCAQQVAERLSFEEVELTWQLVRAESVPTPILHRILRHCFPPNADNIRTYCFIANGSTLPFVEGTALFDRGLVRNVFQIGYHISAQVGVDADAAKPVGSREPPSVNVSIRVDRCRIVYCGCSCAERSTWCRHVIATCMFRVHRPDAVQYRPPIWDSITELSDTKLKKFAQNFINQSPAEVSRPRPTV